MTDRQLAKRLFQLCQDLLPHSGSLPLELQERLRDSLQVGQAALGRWAPRLDLSACVICGRDDYAHAGNGICRSCAVPRTFEHK